MKRMIDDERVNAEILSGLHDQYMETLDGEEMMSYLLDCQEFLKNGDVVGWKRVYGQNQQVAVEPPKAKRRRMSPGAYIWTPHPPCIGCGSSEVVEDAQEATVVCTMCGIVQRTLIGTVPVLTSADRLAEVSPVVVHRYSRIIYFRSFLMGMMGMTEPEISAVNLDSLRRTIVGDASKKSVLVALKKLGWLVKYRRHAVSLAYTLNPSVSPLVIEGDVFIEMLRLFRRVEFFWETDGHKKSFVGRRVFYSYPYVYYQLCYHMNRMDLTGPHHLLCSAKLLKKLNDSYSILAKVANLRCDAETYR